MARPAPRRAGFSLQKRCPPPWRVWRTVAPAAGPNKKSPSLAPIRRFKLGQLRWIARYADATNLRPSGSLALSRTGRPLILRHSMADNPPGIRYSIVVPVFNEAAVLPILLRRLGRLMVQLDGPAESILVDDGSTDCSPIVLQALVRNDPRYRYIGLSRNFGHQVAITAGMDVAAGEAIVIMDADLQDPPEIVGEMITKWKEGFEVVYARRLSRAGDSALKRASANLFYKLLARVSSVAIPADVGDFRLIDRKVLHALRRMPEQDRFKRGMIAWLGALERLK